MKSKKKIEMGVVTLKLNISKTCDMLNHEYV